MTALVVALVLAQALPPGTTIDVPQAPPPPPPPVWRVLKVGEGEPSPGAGCWMDSPTCLSVDQTVRACEAERAELRPVAVRPPPWLAMALAFVAGAGAGIAAIELLQPHH